MRARPCVYILFCLFVKVLRMLEAGDIVMNSTNLIDISQKAPV
uniref:Uncharacterized protein n=1 Tax=Populus trichocarpa TaxID=3694 RepID=A9PFG2_POPTR|nr:unknown [Populus trichocarpa]